MEVHQIKTKVGEEGETSKEVVKLIVTTRKINKMNPNASKKKYV